MLLTLSFASCAQTDTTSVQSSTVGERYTYDSGAKFIKNEKDETEIIEIKDAFVKFRTVDGIVFLTVMYNPSSLFKKKAIEDYRVDSDFFRDPSNETYQSRGSQLNEINDNRHSYLFTFDPNNSQFTITNVSNSMVEYVFTGQHIPNIEEFDKRNEELKKTQLKNFKSN